MHKELINVMADYLAVEERAIDRYMAVDPSWCPPNEAAIDLLGILKRKDEIVCENEKKAFYLSEVALFRDKHAPGGIGRISIAPLGLQLVKAGLIEVPRETVRELIRETARYNATLIEKVSLTPAGEEKAAELFN